MLLRSVFKEKQQPVPPSVEGELMQAVEAQLATLPPKWRALLTYRYGIKDGIPRLLREVGMLPKFGVTTAVIRQQEKRALGALRHPTRSWHLKRYTPSHFLPRQEL